MTKGYQPNDGDLDKLPEYLHAYDIMGVHGQPCPDCRRLLIYNSEIMRTDYRDDGTVSGTTLVVTYKKCQCQKEKQI